MAIGKSDVSLYRFYYFEQLFYSNLNECATLIRDNAQKKIPAQKFFRYNR